MRRRLDKRYQRLDALARLEGWLTRLRGTVSPRAAHFRQSKARTVFGRPIKGMAKID